jgi:hypothetical protein
MMKSGRLAICAVTLLLVMAPAHAAGMTAAEQALWAKANKVCNGPQYPSGSRIVVNYARNTFKCVELGSSRR